MPALDPLPVVFLMGPTAAGKTGLAVALAGELPFEIISVDSAMVYRGMDIGTGKPTPEVQRCAPHRLIDIREPHQPYSAADFGSDARAEVRAIHGAGRIPLLVGGTGLYFRALQAGLSSLPSADTAVRAHLAREAQRRSWRALHRRLERVDPQAAARIHPNDPQRIQRALEVYEVTGRPLSALQATGRAGALDSPVLTLVLDPARRDALHRKIEARFTTMLSAGLVDEVRMLRHDPRLHLGLPSMRAVGYRQVWQHLDGSIDHAEMIERALAATRQLAKRQLTWLRTHHDAPRFDSGSRRLREDVLRYLEPDLGRMR